MRSRSCGSKDFDCEQRRQAHHRSHFHRHHFLFAEVQHVVVEPILLVPQADTGSSHVVHRRRDVHEVLEKFAGHVLVSGILHRQLNRHRQHVQAKHRHPARAVRLIDVVPRAQRPRTVKDADIIQAQKASLEHVTARGIFAVHPPREIYKQLVKGAHEKHPVRLPADTARDFVDAPRRPSLHGRIHVRKIPFVRRKLPVGMHVPFAHKQDELILREIRIDQRHRHAMKGKIPRRIPRVLPLVRHRNHVGVMQVRPFVIAPELPSRVGCRLSGIALKPAVNVVVIALLPPYQSRESLALHEPRVVADSLRRPLAVEFIGFLFALVKPRLKSRSEIILSAAKADRSGRYPSNAIESSNFSPAEFPLRNARRLSCLSFRGSLPRALPRSSSDEKHPSRMEFDSAPDTAAPYSFHCW